MRKQLQQLHNEAAQKRFTTFIALLVMLLFAIGGSLQVQAQDNNTNGTPITGIESLTGCNEDQVRAAVSSGNTFPDNPNQIFFLYNLQCQDGSAAQCRRLLGNSCLLERIRNAAMDTYRQQGLDSPCSEV